MCQPDCGLCADVEYEPVDVSPVNGVGHPVWRMRGILPGDYVTGQTALGSDASGVYVGRDNLGQHTVFRRGPFGSHAYLTPTRESIQLF